MRCRSLLLVAFFFVLLAVTSKTQPMDTRPTGTGSVFYVSRTGNNQDGQSWDTAWNELDQINWERIMPGDTILIDGGDVEMVYETPLDIGQSGSPEQPITIRASSEANHDGFVILFGGREGLLPYCGQQVHNEPSSEEMLPYGIQTHDHDFIVLDGVRWEGIRINGFGTGVRIESGSTNILIRNLLITNNGVAIPERFGWVPDQPGIALGGSHITLQRMVIHDNGQDAIQSLSGENNIADFRLEQSWLYNARRHPTVNQAANYCAHTDGMQIFDGGDVSGITILQSIIGPGFTNGVIFGQTPTPRGAQASVRDVLFRDVVFTKAADNNVIAYRDTSSHNWMLERVTLYCPNTTQKCLRILNSDHAVFDSVVVDGSIDFPDGLDFYAGNCIWNTTGFELGANIAPNFADVSQTDTFSIDDYAVDPASGCRGSLITSAEALFQLE